MIDIRLLGQFIKFHKYGVLGFWVFGVWGRVWARCGGDGLGMVWGGVAGFWGIVVLQPDC